MTEKKKLSSFKAIKENQKLKLLNLLSNIVSIETYLVSKMEHIKLIFNQDGQAMM